MGDTKEPTTNSPDQSEIKTLLENLGYNPENFETGGLTVGEFLDMVENGALGDIVISGDHGGAIPAE
jgi:hypothetical protein